jgi:hypothetical protein
MRDYQRNRKASDPAFLAHVRLKDKEQKKKYRETKNPNYYATEYRREAKRKANPAYKEWLKNYKRERWYEIKGDPNVLLKLHARAMARLAFPIIQPCEKCGSVVDVHRHHDDYSKPLDIRWLCEPHHFELHESTHRSVQ